MSEYGDDFEGDDDNQFNSKNKKTSGKTNLYILAFINILYKYNEF